MEGYTYRYLINND